MHKPDFIRKTGLESLSMPGFPLMSVCFFQLTNGIANLGGQKMPEPLRGDGLQSGGIHPLVNECPIISSPDGATAMGSWMMSAHVNDARTIRRGYERSLQ